MKIVALQESEEDSAKSEGNQNDTPDAGVSVCGSKRQQHSKRPWITSDNENDASDAVDDCVTVHEIARSKHAKRRWTAEELKMFFAYFAKDITARTMPPGKRISQLATKMSNTRTISQIRTQVHNYVSGKIRVM